MVPFEPAAGPSCGSNAPFLRVYPTDEPTDGLGLVPLAEGFAIHASQRGPDKLRGRILRVDEAGELLWEHRLDGEIHVARLLVAANATDTFVVAGDDAPPNGGDWLIRLDGNGEERWRHYLGETVLILDAAVFTDGSILLVGRSMVQPILMLVSGAGERIWTRVLEDVNASAARQVDARADGLTIVSFAHEARRLDPATGAMVWRTEFPPELREPLHVAWGDGKLLLASRLSPLVTGRALALWSLDEGRVLTPVNEAPDVLTGLLPGPYTGLADGSFAVAGHLPDPSTGETRNSLWGVSALGDVQWEADVGLDDPLVWFSEALATQDGGLVAIGFAGDESWSPFLVRLAPGGHTECPAP